MMSHIDTGNSDDFPPNKSFKKDKITRTTQIPGKTIVSLLREKMSLNDTEATLNWQSEIANYQNRMLSSIN